jgi:hypothetical protein
MVQAVQRVFGATEMRKVSIRTVENTIGLARSVANGTTKFPFMGYCADLMEKMLEEINELKARIEELEKKHKEEFDYAEKLLKERAK